MRPASRDYLDELGGAVTCRRAGPRSPTSIPHGVNARALHGRPPGTRDHLRAPECSRARLKPSPRAAPSEQTVRSRHATTERHPQQRPARRTSESHATETPTPHTARPPATRPFRGSVTMQSAACARARRSRYGARVARHGESVPIPATSCTLRLVPLPAPREFNRERAEIAVRRGAIEPRRVGRIALVVPAMHAGPLRDQRGRDHVARMPSHSTSARWST